MLVSLKNFGQNAFYIFQRIYQAEVFQLFTLLRLKASNLHAAGKICYEARMCNSKPRSLYRS